MVEQERAKARQAITGREGVTLGGLKIKNLIDEAAAGKGRRCDAAPSRARKHFYDR